MTRSILEVVGGVLLLDIGFFAGCWWNGRRRELNELQELAGRRRWR